MNYDLVIVGSGAAGLSAGIYAARYKLKTVIIEGKEGGETTTAGSVENYPGFTKIDGYELMKAMRDQAKASGVETKTGWAKEIAKADDCYTVKTEKEKYHAKAVILAIGSQRRHLNLPNEEELTGKGLHYCWTCDGPLYGGKTVAMIGGGDSSVKGVNFLAEYATKIYLIVRGSKIVAEPVNKERMDALGDKVEVLYENEVKELVGTEKLEKLVLAKEHNGSADLVVDGVFVEIGFDPDTTFATQLGLELDEKRYMKTDAMLNTNVKGVFVAGDATAYFGDFKQDITAAALGAVAATSAYEYSRSHDPCDH